MAHFLMKATDDLDLTHNGIEKLCDSVKWLVNSMDSKRAERMKAILSNADISLEMSDNILEACHDCSDELDKLCDRQYRESFHMEHFHYVVSTCTYAIIVHQLNNNVVAPHIETSACMWWRGMGLEVWSE